MTRLHAIWLFAALSGCHLIYPMEPAQERPPSQYVETKHDGGLPETDSSPAEHDGGVKPDSESASPVPTCQTLGLSQLACGGSSYKKTPGQCYSADMVVCNERFAVSQCAAATLCPVGWRLCTPEEFLARGGRKTPALTQAWIYGCVRRQGAPFAPEAGLCDSGCTSQKTGMSAVVQWACDASKITSSSGWSNLALHSSGLCSRQGVDDPANGAFWNRLSVNFGLGAAVCCK